MNIPLLPRFLPRYGGNSQEAEFERRLIRHEAAIGGKLFGAVPAGHNRQFFCLDEHTWIWHEEWTDRQGRQQVVVTRYDVRPTGVIKTQNGGPARPLSAKEASHFIKAVRLYQQKIDAEYQRMLQVV
jgi:hypothetical protein